MSKKWVKFLSFWAAGLLITGFILCVLLYRYCAVYEITRPDPVMDELFSSMTADDFYSAARSNCILNVNEFENPKDIYEAYLSNAKLDDSNLSYRKEVTLSNSDKTVYTIRSGITPIASVTLVPKNTDSPGFGRHEWEIGYISTPDILKNLTPLNVKVFAQSTDTIFINGVEVKREYVNSDDVTVPTLLKYEDSSNISVKFIEYDIGKMYGSVVVTDSNGTELSATMDDEGNICYSASTDNLFSVRISAPDDVTVFINGIEVDYSEGVSKNILFADLLDYTNGHEYDTVTYNISGFYREPLVSAKDISGNELIPIISGKNRYTFLHANEKECENEFLPVVEEFFTKYTDYATSSLNYSALGSLLNRSLRHSEIYEYFLNSTDTMYWTSEITTHYSDIKYDNFSRVGDDCFVCSVKYKIEQTSDSWTNTSENFLDSAYELVFVHHDELWLCAKMERISD